MKLHCIAGLPRAGSTLLAAILRQNPRFRAGVASPVHGLCMAAIPALGAGTEFAPLVGDAARRRVLAGLFHSFHAAPGEAPDDLVVFDSARPWAGRLDLLASLFPDIRVICCVRDVPWVLDSVERIYRRNPLHSSALFGHSPNTTVQQRAAALMEPVRGFVGAAWSAMREGWCSEQAGRLFVLQYESLVADPAAALRALYEALGERPFDHDFGHLAFDEPEYDLRLGMPGLHTVRGPVRRQTRPTVLPRELFEKHAGLAFWRDPADNPGRVVVV